MSKNDINEIGERCMSLETISFTRMDEGTEAEYQLLDRLFKVHEDGLADNVLGMLDRLAGDKLGYKIDRYQHSLQSATRALRDGADEETVVCALLHDIGDILAPQNHSDLAAAILQPYVSEANHWVIKHHGIFQGYYFWHFLGGDRHAREQYRGHPLFDRCARFCERWDQVSFDPDYDTLPIETFQPMVKRIFARQPFGDHLKAEMTDLA
jgi:predicted HD phosphohydrolase